jgi:hypothetical protein
MLKTSVIQRLKKLGVPTNPHLPPIEETAFREASDVAKRINILGIFIAISDDQKSIPFFKELIGEQRMEGELTGIEEAVLRAESLTDQQEIEFSWYKESLYALSWCLAIFDEMTPPLNESTLLKIYEYLPPEVNLNSFVSSAHFREKATILEETEYYYGVHWAIRHPESWGLLQRRKLKKLNLSVVRERRRALEWVINKSLSWDEISLDT